MTWKWDEFTSPNFRQATQDTKGVCLVPIGVLEKHGGHLPLGTDCIAIQTIAEQAAEKEPAIVFPVIPYGQIHEAKHQAGAIAIKTDIVLRLLENICDEISRNGLKKIVFLNGHGGNEYLLGHFAMSMLERKRDYVVYVIRLRDYFPTKERLQEMGTQSAFDGHGGEVESSLQMAINPELVKLTQIEPNSGTALGRLNHLENVFTAMFWYANFPDHYAGDASAANPELGRKMLAECAHSVALLLARIKADETTAQLQQEFFGRLEHK